MEPPPAYRGTPFWLWNGALHEEELIRQIPVMKEMGLGGFFMHSRTGLATEYPGDEWFAWTNACADEAAKPAFLPPRECVCVCVRMAAQTPP